VSRARAVPPLLASATSPEVAASKRPPMVVVPIGSLEQHGPHLPLDTDTAIAEAVAAGLVSALGSSCWLAPAIAFGNSGEHQHFAGTVSIGGPVLRLVVVELVRSLRTWCGTVVLVNGHGGNLETLHAAVGQLRSEGHDVVLVPCAPAGSDLHAGRTETSLMLHLRPESVRLGVAESGNTGSLRDLLPVMRLRGVAGVSANGVLGDPSGASAAEGERLLAELVDAARAHLASART